MNNESSGSKDAGAKEKQLFECQVRMRDMPNQLKKITIEALSQEEAVQKAAADGYMIISIKSAGEKQKIQHLQEKAKLNLPVGKEQKMSKPLFPSLQRVTTRELIFFAIQLSTLIKAGVPLLRSIEIIAKGMKNMKFLEVLKKIAARIAGGFGFGAALKEHQSIFPWIWFNLVEVGEATGKLPECLEEIAAYQEASMRIKRKVITAFFYPGILTVAVLGALAFLMVFVVPKFSEIFIAQKMPLPAITQVVVGMSNAFRQYWYLIPVIILPIMMLGVYIKKVERARLTFDMYALSAPIFGPLLLQVAVVRFSRGLNTMLKAGVQILQALDIGSRLTENKYLETKIGQVAKAVKGGQGLGAQMEARKIFPIFMTQLVSVGEETGQIDKFLEIIADYYEEQVDSFLARLSTMIEPILLIVMGAIIGTVVISMFLPIIELSTKGGMGA